MKRILITFLILAICSACATQKQAHIHEVYVINDLVVTLVDEARIDEVCDCKPTEGCKGCYIYWSDRSMILAVKPDHWKDYARIETLGHELLHAIGYDHKDYSEFQPKLERWR